MNRPGFIDLTGVSGFAADRTADAIWTARAAKTRRLRRRALLALGAAAYAGAIAWMIIALVRP